MKCSCPKCSESIIIDSTGNLEEGEFTTCPLCSSRFWAQREAFMLRAYKKEQAVFCSHCGDEVGATNFCISCFTPFPDYWVVQLNKPARRKTHNPIFAFGGPSRVNHSAKSFAISTGSTSDFADTIFGSFSRVKNSFAVIAILLLVIGLGTTGTFYYQDYKAKQTYIKNYVRALYGIQSGIDVSFTRLSDMSSSGLPLAEKDVAKLLKTRLKIDTIRSNLDTPPEFFTSSYQALSKLYMVYTELHKQAIAPAGLTEESKNRIQKIEEKLAVAKQALKNNAHKDIAEEVQTVVVKYKNLKYMTE